MSSSIPFPSDPEDLSDDELFDLLLVTARKFGCPCDRPIRVDQTAKVLRLVHDQDCPLQKALAEILRGKSEKASA